MKDIIQYRHDNVQIDRALSPQQSTNKDMLNIEVKKSEPRTLYEEAIEKGYSRRDFMKFCTTLAAFMGLEASGAASIARALETKSRPAVIWMHFQECKC